MSTERKKFSDDPRGGSYIDDGVNPVRRVEDTPETETPAAAPSTEATPEVGNNG